MFMLATNYLGKAKRPRLSTFILLRPYFSLVYNETTSIPPGLCHFPTKAARFCRDNLLQSTFCRRYRYKNGMSPVKFRSRQRNHLHAKTQEVHVTGHTEKE